MQVYLNYYVIKQRAFKKERPGLVSWSCGPVSLAGQRLFLLFFAFLS